MVFRFAVLPLLLVAIAFCALIVACGDSDDVGVTTPTVTAGGEATYGTIERLPGGTAVVVSPHKLVAVACEGSTLTLTTTASTFMGTMDCSAMPPGEVISGYIDEEIAIAIGGGRLKIESPSVGSLDFPATDVTS